MRTAAEQVMLKLGERIEEKVKGKCKKRRKKKKKENAKSKNFGWSGEALGAEDNEVSGTADDDNDGKTFEAKREAKSEDAGYKEGGDGELHQESEENVGDAMGCDGKTSVLEGEGDHGDYGNRPSTSDELYAKVTDIAKTDCKDGVGSKGGRLETEGVDVQGSATSRIWSTKRQIIDKFNEVACMIDGLARRLR
eukprot:TRINITY_DN29803_c0_g1_i1.p2 TRINITY_DN29803_c0_g1~~TRINITY_DN29803_c0_g1_i1.p2  ORF type:complete len:194 (-),score=58.04 TRINITY_DN29803_c0_g1_i1:10-591(-)